VVEVAGAFGMFFFLVADEAPVGLDFSVRIEGSPAVAPRPILELDVLVDREFGLSHKNLLRANTEKPGNSEIS
jgi:hypothetical protein